VNSLAIFNVARQSTLVVVCRLVAAAWQHGLGRAGGELSGVSLCRLIAAPWQHGLGRVGGELSGVSLNIDDTGSVGTRIARLDCP
jgi:hypothetical protein